MAERWVDFHGTFINMAHVSQIKVEERIDDEYFDLVVYFTWCYPASEYEGLGSRDAKETIMFGDHDKMVEEAHAIIRGDYDVPMGAEPTHAQGGDGLPDPVFNIDDRVTVHSVVNGERQRPPDAEGVVVHYQLGEDGGWEYQVRYDDCKVSEWLPEVHLFHDLPF